MWSRECKSVRVLFGTQQAAARVLALDVESDLAVLQTALNRAQDDRDAQQPAAAPGRQRHRLRLSAVRVAVPGGNLTTGNVSALAGLRDDPKYIQVTAPVQPGNSGGPLLDGGGNLVGVITAKLDAIAIAKRTGDIPQNVNFAVKAEVLEAFLRANNIPYDVAVTDRQLAVADVAEMAKEATVKIVCCAVGRASSASLGRCAFRLGVDPSPPLPLPPPPQDVPGRPVPVPSDAVRRADDGADSIGRGPHTVPGNRPRAARTGDPQSFRLQRAADHRRLAGRIAARQCPTARGAYRGTKELFASLKPGESATLTGEFSGAAGYFLRRRRAILPPPRQRRQPRVEPPAAEPQQPAPPPEDAEPPEVTVPPSESEPTPEPAPTQ